MDIKVFKFPMIEQGFLAMQAKYCEIMRKIRNNEKVEREELDWFDWADSILAELY